MPVTILRRLQLHGEIYRPDSFVLMLRYCANLKAIRYESTSLNRIVADKSHRVIVAEHWPNLSAEKALLSLAITVTRQLTANMLRDIPTVYCQNAYLTLNIHISAK